MQACPPWSAKAQIYQGWASDRAHRRVPVNERMLAFSLECLIPNAYNARRMNPTGATL
jgi:hypothetical protein